MLNLSSITSSGAELINARRTEICSSLATTASSASAISSEVSPTFNVGFSRIALFDCNAVRAPSSDCQEAEVWPDIA